MFRRTVLLASLGSALLLAGCRTPQQPMNPGFSIPESVTAAEVEKAIKLGAIRRGWTTKEIKPGLIQATYVKGSYTDCVDIAYKNKSWGIEMNPKTNMKNADGTVNPKYNQWVRNLAHDIGKELQIICTTR